MVDIGSKSVKNNVTFLIFVESVENVNELCGFGTWVHIKQIYLIFIILIYNLTIANTVNINTI